jgi:DNA primase
MSDDKTIILDILSEILGDPQKVYDTKLQYGYNCPECGMDETKGNLEVSLEKHLFHCWSCGDINNTKGTLGKLIDKYGNKNHKKIYNLIKPEEFKDEEKKKTYVKLPKGYVQFKDSNKRFIPHQEALRYLHSRGVTDEMIEKYQIGYTVDGEFAYRVILPSYDKDGYLNYFIARAWVPKKMKYKNPTVPKDEIIFNEQNIDFNKDIYLSEGAFDMLFLDNCIPLLGKHVSTLLFERLYNEAKGDIHICLDGDAYDNAVQLYHKLNGGVLYSRIKIVKLPKDKDVCDLRGDINEYYVDLMR